ncbi:hypothetical protein BDW42DRAFT_190405 [Aspergillus taichungensis]|uniref:Uncharacterized protein n=1 Tax=Aspergillus taichungensis TaxID=482145 RepID=A0A2J5I7C1_9EURO|nr:hypothetical protein BDW42DRAFT_190405 [Aspergillus taichungensis]
MNILRRLELLALIPRMEDLHRRGSSLYANQVFTRATMDDAGLSVLWRSTNQDKANMTPAGRVQQTKYLAHDTPKLRYLMRIMAEEGIMFTHPPAKRRVFCQWPAQRVVGSDVPHRELAEEVFAAGGRVASASPQWVTRQRPAPADALRAVEALSSTHYQPTTE